MKVDQNKDGKWVVIDSTGKVIETFDTMDQAWRWIDRHETHPLHLRRATAERMGVVDVSG